MDTVWADPMRFAPIAVVAIVALVAWATRIDFKANSVPKRNW